VSNSSLTIAINDRALRPPKTGIGHYVHELLRWLPTVAPQHRYWGLVTHALRRGRPWREAAGRTVDTGAPVGRLPWPLRRAVQAGYESAFRVMAWHRGADLYHEPNNIAMRWRGRIVTTVHDLSVLRHPAWHPADRVAWYRREFEPSLRRTHHFITPSEFTKRELRAMFDVQPDRVTVIPQAPREPFVPKAEEAIAALRQRLDLPERFLLFVGTLEPRKNVDGLLAAYASLSSMTRAGVPLLIAGAGGWGVSGFDERTARYGVRANVRMVGYLGEEDLATLYAAARALVWPSWYEGFGLPPLECMACGTPVVTTNAASVPEVVGDAAVAVDPADQAGLAEAMRRMIDDDAEAAALTARGRARAALFTWARCAAEHAAVYERTVQMNG
jgi:glycosyltransferase involved in cell wall biosynthesis